MKRRAIGQVVLGLGVGAGSLLVGTNALAQPSGAGSGNGGAYAAAGNATSGGTAWSEPSTTAPQAPVPPADVQQPTPPADVQQPAPPPVQYVAVPIEMAPGYEPPPPPPRKVDPTKIHNHDGFFLRMGIGGGYLWDTMTESSFEYKIRGNVLPLELLIGGSLVPGLVLGGGLWLSPAVQFRGDGDGPEGPLQGDFSLMFAQFGPFVDYYLNPKEGLHFLLAATLANVQLSAKDSLYSSLDNSLAQGAYASEVRATGFALTGGIGQEFWIGNQWSAGGMLRLTYASLEDTNAGIVSTHHVWNPALVATFTYH